MVTEVEGTYQQPNSYERLRDWTTDELREYERDMLDERRVLWADPSVQPNDYRLRVLEQLLSDVRDVLWGRTCAAWRAEEMAA